MARLFDTILSPYAPSSEEDLLAAVGRGAAGKDDAEILQAANRALARMERFTRRLLMERVHRTAVTATGALTVDSPSVTGVGFSDLYAGDDVVADSAVQVWTRIAAIASNTAMTLTRNATATDSVTLTCGSRPLVTQRVDEHELLIPEFPVSDLFSIHYKDSEGDLVEVDITGHQLVRATGLCYLPNDTLPEGEANLVVACRAGFAAPSGSSRGDPEVGDLQHCLHRLTGYLFTDTKGRPSRETSTNIGKNSFSVPDYSMPADVLDILRSFRRRW